jgi:ankyrin repeat protein
MHWLVSVDDRKGELEQWNGRDIFEWPLASFQPVWNWEKRVEGESSKKTHISKQINPMMFKILLHCSQRDDHSLQPLLNWMVSVGVSMDGYFPAFDVDGIETSTTALELAVTAKDISAVAYLVETVQVPLLPPQLSLKGDGPIQSALDAVVNAGALEIFEYLADKVRERHSEFDFDSMREDWTILGIAAFNGHLDIFCLLVDKYGASRCEMTGYSVWELIACGGNVEIWRFTAKMFPRLLEEQPPAIDTLSMAIQNSHTEMFDLLLDDLRMITEDEVILSLCIRGSTGTQMINHFYNRGASMLMTIDGRDFKSSALNEAVLDGKLDMVKWFISIGLSVNRRARNGKTPLICASQYGHIEIVKWLLANGASPSAIHPKNGRTPRDFATREGHQSVVQLLARLYNN